MKPRYSALVLVAIVLSMAIVVQIDSVQTADAVKAKGIKNSQYGAETKNKVCGDRLCTPEDFTKQGEKKKIAPSGETSISSQIALSKMERLFELHRMQLLSAWDSMSDSDKSHMMKMFDKMYDKMKSMTFKDHMKHMKKMMDGKHGMKDMHDKSGCACGDMKHGMDCNCSEDGTCSCGEGCTCTGENCSCGESGECTCGTGCDCSGASHGDMKHGCSCGDGEHGCSCGDGESSMACETSSEECNCSEDGVCNCGEGCTCASCH